MLVCLQMFHERLSRGKSLIGGFVDFCGVKSPPTAKFKLPTGGSLSVECGRAHHWPPVRADTAGLTRRSRKSWNSETR